MQSVDAVWLFYSLWHSEQVAKCVCSMKINRTTHETEPLQSIDRWNGRSQINLNYIICRVNLKLVNVRATMRRANISFWLCMPLHGVCKHAATLANCCIDVMTLIMLEPNIFVFVITKKERIIKKTHRQTFRNISNSKNTLSTNFRSRFVFCVTVAAAASVAVALFCWHDEGQCCNEM